MPRKCHGDLVEMHSFWRFTCIFYPLKKSENQRRFWRFQGVLNARKSLKYTRFRGSLHNTFWGIPRGHHLFIVNTRLFGKRRNMAQDSFKFFFSLVLRRIMMISFVEIVPERSSKIFLKKEKGTSGFSRKILFPRKCTEMIPNGTKTDFFVFW